MEGRDGYLFGILIDPSCSQIFKIRLTAPPDKAPIQFAVLDIPPKTKIPKIGPNTEPHNAIEI